MNRAQALTLTDRRHRLKKNGTAFTRNAGEAQYWDRYVDRSLLSSIRYTSVWQSAAVGLVENHRRSARHDPGRTVTQHTRRNEQPGRRWRTTDHQSTGTEVWPTPRRPTGRCKNHAAAHSACTVLGGKIHSQVPARQYADNTRSSAIAQTARATIRLAIAVSK